MKKKMIVLSIVVVLLIGVICFFVYRKNDEKTIVLLDINPSFEIVLDRKEKVVEVKGLNDDAKKVIDYGMNTDSLDEVLNSIIVGVLDNNMIGEDKVGVLLYIEGSIDKEKFKNRVINEWVERNIEAEVILINKITEEDKKLAEEYNINPSKAAYINSIIKDNENMKVEDLIDKSITEIKETNDTGNYCDEGYFLDGGFCYKEVGRVSALFGSVCPDKYMEYKGTCYKSTHEIESDKYSCREGYVLEGNDCKRTDTHPAEIKCNKGELRDNKCYEKVIIGEAYEFCRDPGRTLYQHKCLATKPTINGGCLNGDMLLNGKCVNTRNDYYMAEWKCSNGFVKSNHDGTLVDNDTHCYEEKLTNDYSYLCEDGHTLVGDKCTITYVEAPEKVMVCPSGYTKISEGRCIDQSDSKSKIENYYCKNEADRLRDTECITYDRVNAKHY